MKFKFSTHSIARLVALSMPVSAAVADPALTAAKDLFSIPVGDSYSLDQFTHHTASVTCEYLTLFSAITTIGLANWDWGSAKFTFNSEGWFYETKRGSGGMDKIGHTFSTYAMADVLHQSIRAKATDPQHAELTAGLLSMSLATYIEVFDGFSDQHGFSYEDLLMNGLGAGFSVLRNSVPGMAEKVDFRLQYLPSPYDTFNPLGDYRGQKYLLAVKFAGFEMFRESPLRYIELHGGYGARGFTIDERRDGVRQERNLYLGIGVNLQEVLFPAPSPQEPAFKTGARPLLRYLQIPYTYVASDGNSGR
jgi:hypothetical protein